MRASRLVQILLLLQTRGRMTAPELARELEVSVRTIYRDLDALSTAGVPVYSETGRYGGARLVDGYRTRLTGLTVDEADAVLLAGIPGPAAELGLGTVLAAAQLKVLAALPPELRGRATRVRERFHLDAPGWFHRQEETPHLAIVAEALWADRKVRVGYRRDDRTVERTLDPLGLVLKAGTWYLVARCGDDLRTYRASRILAAEVLDERFDRPEGFQLADHWADSADAFERTKRVEEARCRVRASCVRELRWAIDPSAARAVEDQAAALGADHDGWLELTIPTEKLEYLATELLRLGPNVEVLEPPELRDRMAETTAAMAAMYARTPAPA
ncbi:MAG: YafY family transcriptional regulator [Acidimicrobiia bacterium]|nr:YafY family transcriptional regulator [Acidimicrobiia bacterium]